MRKFLHLAGDAGSLQVPEPGDSVLVAPTAAKLTAVHPPADQAVGLPDAAPPDAGLPAIGPPGAAPPAGTVGGSVRPPSPSLSADLSASSASAARSANSVSSAVQSTGPRHPVRPEFGLISCQTAVNTHRHTIDSCPIAWAVSPTAGATTIPTTVEATSSSKVTATSPTVGATRLTTTAGTISPSTVGTISWNSALLIGGRHGVRRTPLAHTGSVPVQLKMGTRPGRSPSFRWFPDGLM
jgi:hypothetical protein